MHEENFIPYTGPQYDSEETVQKASAFRSFMDQRRSIRYFSDKPIPEGVLEDLIMTGSSAPSGAHKQPWTFCLITNADTKSAIREAAEKEEYENYHGRMSEEWLEDLKPFGTDWKKEFLEIAPALVVLFKKAYDVDEEGNKHKNYYVNESVGLAAGFFLAAVHNAGLVSLTHTPSPMNFLQKLLDRPQNERPFLLMPIGYPAEGATVPDLSRKSEDDVIQRYD